MGCSERCRIVNSLSHIKTQHEAVINVLCSAFFCPCKGLQHSSRRILRRMPSDRIYGVVVRICQGFGSINQSPIRVWLGESRTDADWVTGLHRDTGYSSGRKIAVPLASSMYQQFFVKADVFSTDTSVSPSAPMV